MLAGSAVAVAQRQLRLLIKQPRTRCSADEQSPILPPDAAAKRSPSLMRSQMGKAEPSMAGFAHSAALSFSPNA
jgi:hypothetical protein